MKTFCKRCNAIVEKQTTNNDICQNCHNTAETLAQRAIEETERGIEANFK